MPHSCVTKPSQKPVFCESSSFCRFQADSLGGTRLTGQGGSSIPPPSN